MSVSSALCPPRFEPHTLMNSMVRNFIFERVWRTVESDYIHKDFYGQDAKALYKEHRDKALAATTNRSFYWRLDDMILALGDNHSVYLSPWDSCLEDGFYDSEDNPYEVALPTVKRHELYSSVLVVKLPSFDSFAVPLELENALDSSFAEAPVEALVLDLRDNYGGYLEAAYRVLEHFVSGTVGYQYDRWSSYPIDRLKGNLYEQLKDIPLVVLINENTHSAAEIVAGVLQAERSATVIGLRSAGNTEMILPFDFVDGSRLWLAVGGFILADGSNIEGKGVKPDVLLSGTSQDTFVVAALEVLGFGQLGLVP